MINIEYSFECTRLRTGWFGRELLPINLCRLVGMRRWGTSCLEALEYLVPDVIGTWVKYLKLTAFSILKEGWLILPAYLRTNLLVKRIILISLTEDFQLNFQYNRSNLGLTSMSIINVKFFVKSRIHFSESQTSNVYNVIIC